MKNLNHYGHVYSSINELEKIFKRDYEILTIHHKVNYDYGISTVLLMVSKF